MEHQPEARSSVGVAIGSRHDFDRLVLEHLPAAQRFAIRLCGEPDDAEDVVQEALARVARSWRTFSGRSSFRTWFFQIVVNSFRDHRRRCASRADRIGKLTENVGDARAVPPIERLESEELAAFIARQVSLLPVRQREVLVLSVYEQASNADIATMLGISPENVRVNLHLARQRLRGVLKDYLPEKTDERE